MGKEEMFVTRQCRYCNGTGVRMVETSSLFGLIRKQVPLSCEMCAGAGSTFQAPSCKHCDGQGLIGNEREVCRTCNGVGHWDAFAYIPRDHLHVGTLFDRRCDQCDHNRMEIASEIEEYKQVLSWEKEEELRSVEHAERVKVRCPSCSHSYYIKLDADSHGDLTPDMVEALEKLGIDLSYMYQAR
ncbi:MAG: hypothetical protein H7A35_12100 [Planctomycetales bacterium]|nr:hypothetical protein [bacterium]UNM07598.1 MAG: hypothetical protein H7A35_12100 [Planctomycetales bacterium]